MSSTRAIPRTLRGSHGRSRLSGLTCAARLRACRVGRDIDLLGEIAGVGGYDALARHTIAVEIFGLRCLCLDLPTLIRAKSAAGRPKDLDALAELRALLEEKGGKP